tara:strand:+ start:1135 stop:1902 length:768 start_codon:yes stop_codon:yes gene_type:complete
MKSPLQDKVRASKALRCLKEKIPQGSIVQSYLFFAGNIELGLSQANRFIIGHTNRPVVYEFWKCAEDDPRRISQIARSFLPIDDSEAFQLFQQTWTSCSDPYIRSALLFLLNRSTESGTVSSGKLMLNSFNPLAFSYLENLKLDNFHIILDEGEGYPELTRNFYTDEAEILLVPACVFKRGLSGRGKLRGPEETIIDHRKMQKTLQETEQKWVILYKKYPEILELYADHNIIMIDAYGRETKNQKRCEELVIANF